MRLRNFDHFLKVVEELDENDKLHLNAKLGLTSDAFGAPVTAFVHEDDVIPARYVKELVRRLREAEEKING